MDVVTYQSERRCPKIQKMIFEKNLTALIEVLKNALLKLIH